MPNPTTDADDAADQRFLASGPGRRGKRRQTPGPVIEAYADGQIDRSCDNCGAGAHTFCRHPSGAFRKIPCPNR